MKKILFVFLMLFVTFSLFSTGEKEQAKDEALPKVIWYMPGSDLFPYTGEDAVYEKFNSMLAKDLGIQVEIQVPGTNSEFNEKMPLIMAAGEPWDITFTAAWCNAFVPAAEDGLYAGLDDLLPQYAPKIYERQKESLESLRVGGEIRAIWHEIPAFLNASFLYQENLAEKYDWDVKSVKLLKDIEPFLADVKENEPDIIPLQMRKAPVGFTMSSLGIYFLPIGGIQNLICYYLDDESGTLYNFLDMPEIQEVIYMLHDWYKKGYIPQDGLTYSQDQWRQMWNAERVAIDLHNAWVPGREVQVYPSGNRFIREPYGPTIEIAGLSGGSKSAVSAVSKYKAEAVQLLEYMFNNADAHNLLAWGIEGKHYSKNQDGTISLIPNSGYKAQNWALGNQYLSYVQEGENPMANKIAAEAWEKRKKAKLVGWVEDRSEIDSYIPSIISVRDQYHLSIAGGYIDPEKGIDEYKAALNKAGLDKVIAILQSQVDEWLAEQE